jgi:hypothetical protein
MSNLGFELWWARGTTTQPQVGSLEGHQVFLDRVRDIALNVVINLEMNIEASLSWGKAGPL